VAGGPSLSEADGFDVNRELLRNAETYEPDTDRWVSGGDLRSAGRRTPPACFPTDRWL
jgi:hypothetical protein